MFSCLFQCFLVSCLSSLFFVLCLSSQYQAKGNEVGKMHLLFCTFCLKNIFLCNNKGTSASRGKKTNKKESFFIHENPSIQLEPRFHHVGRGGNSYLPLFLHPKVSENRELKGMRGVAPQTVACRAFNRPGKRCFSPRY